MKVIWDKIRYEPQWVAELIRLIIPVLILFGLIHWTGEQVAGVMAIISFIAAAAVRQATVPVAKVNDSNVTVMQLTRQAEDNNLKKTLVILVLSIITLGLTACSLFTSDHGRSPERTVALYGTEFTQSIRDVKNVVRTAYDSKIPKFGPVEYNKFLDVYIDVNAYVVQLGEVLKRYDAATDDATKQLLATEVNTLLSKLDTGVPGLIDYVTDPTTQDKAKTLWSKGKTLLLQILNIIRPRLPAGTTTIQPVGA